MTDPEHNLQSDNGHRPGVLGLCLLALCYGLAVLDAGLSAAWRWLKKITC